jgi:hypothetical protein
MQREPLSGVFSHGQRPGGQAFSLGAFVFLPRLQGFILRIAHELYSVVFAAIPSICAAL